MKNFLTICILTIASLSYGQKEIVWFDTGFKVMYGGSSALSSMVSDASNLDYNLAFGNSTSLGGKFGINFGYSGLALELMYNKGNATIQNLTAPQDSELDWTNIELYTLFRNNANLGFFELGPKFSMLQSLDRTTGSGEVLDLKEAELTNNLNISAVLSMGVLLLGNDRSFSGQVGLRFEYGFTDMIAEGAGRTAFEPFPDVLTSTSAVEYGKTVPLYAGLVFELNFGLGFYGVSQCGGRPKLFGF